MYTAEYENIFRHEERHFFYVATHSLVLSFLKKLAPLKKNMRILDAGCGTGLLAKKLEHFGTVIGIDVSKHAVRYAKTRGVTVQKASITELPFNKSTFDIIVCIDVLYHRAVSSEQKALAEFFRVLKPDGFLILRVPANKWLFLSHDRFVHTKKRYEKTELSDMLKAAGFTVEILSYVNALLLPVASVAYIVERMHKTKSITSNVKQVPFVVNKLLIGWFLLENKMLRMLSLPFGLGLIVVAKKTV